MGDIFNLIKLEKGFVSDGKLAKWIGTSTQNVSQRKNKDLGIVDKKIYEYLLNTRGPNAPITPPPDRTQLHSDSDAIASLNKQVIQLESKLDLMREQMREKDTRIESLITDSAKLHGAKSTLDRYNMVIKALARRTGIKEAEKL